MGSLKYTLLGIEFASFRSREEMRNQPFTWIFPQFSQVFVFFANSCRRTNDCRKLLTGFHEINSY